jgi:hypothetical protein
LHIGRGGTGVLKVDSKEVTRQAMEHSIPLLMQWDENFDIGADTGTPVDDSNTGGTATTRMIVNTSGGVTIGGSDLASTNDLFYVTDCEFAIQ